MSSRHLCVTVFVVAVLLFSGCSDKPQTAPAKQLILYCGAGIRPPVDELIEVFSAEHGAEVVPDFAGSEVLLSKLKLAHRGDLYMPGDSHYVDQAAESDLVLSRRTVGYWIPTILVQKGNPMGIRTLQDLLKPDVRLGLGDPNVCAIGKIAKRLLEKNGIAWADIEKNLKFKSLTVNELGMQIQAGSLDAVIVWDAMARYYEDSGDEVSIPQENNTISTIDIAVLSFTRNKELAEEFCAFLTSEKGREIFEKHRYTTQKPIE